MQHQFTNLWQHNTVRKIALIHRVEPHLILGWIDEDYMTCAIVNPLRWDEIKEMPTESLEMWQHFMTEEGAEPFKYTFSTCEGPKRGPWSSDGADETARLRKSFLKARMLDTENITPPQKFVAQKPGPRETIIGSIYTR